jgi:excinuclease ABC subunit B
MAEDLTDFLKKSGLRVRYMHHDITSLERMEIIRDLRRGEFDALVGINLLREGLDLPEVSLVTILDADKEGFLRSSTSLIQTVGRAARNVNGTVIMYADTLTASMKWAISETERRRKLQSAFNAEHGIVPTTIVKNVRDLFEISEAVEEPAVRRKDGEIKLTKKEREAAITKLEKEMAKASRLLEFEYAAVLRDRLIELRSKG